MINSIREITLAGYLDIFFMFLLLYVLLVAFKKTRAAFVLKGIVIVACIYLLTRQFNLVMTASVFEKFFTIIFIILVVIFQEELRHFFEEIAVWSLNRRIEWKKRIPLSRNEVDTLVKTLMDFSRARVGALIIIRGKNILDRHLDGEIPLHGVLSEPLLKSIFDPHSIGHDGAVIMEGNRVTHFAAHLPLSKTSGKLKEGGTRHAAALGLSEVSDALCLVVSEERGTVSVARKGHIQIVGSADELTSVLNAFYEETLPAKAVKPWEEFFKHNSREKVYALLLSLGLWFVLVHGSKVTYRTYLVPVSYAVLPAEWTVTSIDPPDVEVKLRGPRTAFYLNIKDRIKLFPDIKMKKGAQKIRILESHFTLPKGVTLDEYDPRNITITFDSPPQKEPAKAKGKNSGT
jgi:uncharacterized protein (TIGR00159 family)